MSGSIAPQLPLWAQWFAALAVPIAAVIGLAIGVANLSLARKKRQDELFDRRYACFLDFLRIEDFVNDKLDREVRRIPGVEEVYEELLSGDVSGDLVNMTVFLRLLRRAEADPDLTGEVSRLVGEFSEKFFNARRLIFVRRLAELFLRAEFLFEDVRRDALVQYLKLDEDASDFEASRFWQELREIMAKDLRLSA